MIDRHCRCLDTGVPQEKGIQVHSLVNQFRQTHRAVAALGIDPDQVWVRPGPEFLQRRDELE
jgi:hypothetical protein